MDKSVDELFAYCFANFHDYDNGKTNKNPYTGPITYECSGEVKQVPESIQQEAIILYNNEKNKQTNKPEIFTFRNLIILLVCLFLLYMYFR